MEMNDIRRAIVRSAIQKGIREIRQDPKRGVRKLVDLGSHFSRGRFQKRIFEMMQQELVNPHSAYYALVLQMVSCVRPEALEQFGLNVGYNSWTCGAEKIRNHEAQHGYNVPWCLVLDLRRGLEFDLDDLMSQGEALGIYSYMVFAGDNGATAAMCSIFHNHRDSAVFLLLPGAQLPEVNLENVENAMVLLPAADEKTPASAQELLDKGCLFGIWAEYGDQEAAQVADGALERVAMELKAPIVFAVAQPQTGETARSQVRAYAQKTREEKKQPVFLVDFYSAIEEIDRIISVEPCMLGIEGDGTVFTTHGHNDKIDIVRISLEDVLMCTMPSVTYSLQDDEKKE